MNCFFSEVRSLKNSLSNVEKANSARIDYCLYVSKVNVKF